MCLHKLQKSYIKEETRTNFEFLVHEDMQDIWRGGMLKSEIGYFFYHIFSLLYLFVTILQQS